MDSFRNRGHAPGNQGRTLSLQCKILTQDRISSQVVKCKLRSAVVMEPGAGARFCMHAACNKF